MKIPKSVKIGGYNYKVSFKGMEDLKRGGGEKDDLCGTCDPLTSEISILQELTKEQKLSTFIHECIEAYNHVYGMKLTHNQICQAESMVFDLFQQLKK
jgi:hypothetical protein